MNKYYEEVRKLIRDGDAVVSTTKLVELTQLHQSYSEDIYKSIELYPMLETYKKFIPSWLNEPEAIVEEKLRHHKFSTAEVKLLITFILFHLEGEYRESVY